MQFRGHCYLIHISWVIVIFPPLFDYITAHAQIAGLFLNAILMSRFVEYEVCDSFSHSHSCIHPSDFPVSQP